MNIFVMNYLSLKVCPAVVDFTSILMGFELRLAHSVHIKGKNKRKKEGARAPQMQFLELLLFLGFERQARLRP